MKERLLIVTRMACSIAQKYENEREIIDSDAHGCSIAQKYKNEREIIDSDAHGLFNRPVIFRLDMIIVVIRFMIWLVNRTSDLYWLNLTGT